MNTFVAAIGRQWNRLSMRERWIAVATLLVFAFMLWNLLFYAPLNQDIETLELELTEVDRQISEMRVQQVALQNRLADDPDSENRKLLESLKTQAEDLDSKLERASIQILEPQEMNRMLRAMLEQQNLLEFVSLKNKPAVPAFSGTHSDGENGSRETVSIYRHSVVLEVRGSYDSLLSYLKKLESLQWRFFWQDIDIQSQDYPDALISLEVYTLSFRKGVVGA